MTEGAAAAASGISLEQLLSRLAACYDSAAGRGTKNGDCSQQEVLLLLSDACFLPACQQIVEEIQSLERQQQPGSRLSTDEKEQQQNSAEEGRAAAAAAFGQAPLMKFIQSRGYLDISPGMLHAKTALQDFSLRRLLLFNLLVDLQTVRLACKKRLLQDLLPQGAATAAAAAGPTAAAGGESGQSSATAALLEALQAVSAAAGLPPNTPASLSKEEALSILSQAYDNARRIGGEQLQRAAASRMLLPVPVPGKTPQEQQQLLQQLQQLTTALDAHYLLRRKAMMRRHDVTVQAFLWSRRAEKYEEEIAAVLQKAAAWKQAVVTENHVGLYDVFAAEKGVLLSCCRPRAAKREATSFKTLMLGPVPVRGGIPEGYSARAFIEDVRRANASMKAKDNKSSSSSSSFRGSSSSGSSAAYAHSNSFVQGSGYNGTNSSSNDSSSHRGRGQGGGQQHHLASRRPGPGGAAAAGWPAAGGRDGGRSSRYGGRPASSSFAPGGAAAAAATRPPARYQTMDPPLPTRQQQQPLEQQPTLQYPQQQQFYQHPQQQYQQQQPSHQRSFAGNRGRGGGAARGRGGGGRGGAAGGGGGFGGRASDRPVTWNPAG